MSTRHQRFHWGSHRDRPPVAPNSHIQSLARRYNASHGLRVPRDVRVSLTPSEGKALADAYDSARDASGTAEMRRAYSAFNREVAEQHATLLRAGYVIEPWIKPGQPYRDSAAMMADVREHHHLWYFRSSEGTVPHALLTHRQNDQFRAVHDVFGHAKGGNQFGPSGETSAYVSHVQMFTPQARPAVTAETLGQNAWFNYGPHAGLPPGERPFAEQKAAQLDPSLYEPIVERGLGEARSRDRSSGTRQAPTPMLRSAWTGRMR